MIPFFRASERVHACKSHVFVRKHARILTRWHQYWPGEGWLAACRLCGGSLLLTPEEVPHLSPPEPLQAELFADAPVEGPSRAVGGNPSAPAHRQLYREEGEVFIDSDPTLAIRIFRGLE